MQAQASVVAHPAACQPVFETAPAMREVVDLHRVNLKSVLEAQAGKLVYVEYTKADGSTRTMIGRSGVYSFLKGGVNRVVAEDRPYVTLFDMQILAYRTVNLSTVSQLRAGGRVYNVID